MEKIVPCNHRKQRDSNIMRSISNKHQRTVLAEGIEPTDTHGKRKIRSNIINYNH